MSNTACTLKLQASYFQPYSDLRGKTGNAKHFGYAEETKLAWEEGKLSTDIIEEQRKVTEADLIIFQFSMYWFTVPAITKGWFDWVLTLGFAYSQDTSDTAMESSRARKPCCLSPLVLMSPCSEQLAMHDLKFASALKAVEDVFPFSAQLTVLLLLKENLRPYGASEAWGVVGNQTNKQKKKRKKQTTLLSLCSDMTGTHRTDGY
uniref:Flavodoxin-like fold domain-containing protein n=1 Tax=Seriola dumerili TaxID=41447 RepID=A0A3B4TX26_SERDU